MKGIDIIFNHYFILGTDKTYRDLKKKRLQSKPFNVEVSNGIL